MCSLVSYTIGQLLQQQEAINKKLYQFFCVCCVKLGDTFHTHEFIFSST